MVEVKDLNKFLNLKSPIAKQEYKFDDDEEVFSDISDEFASSKAISDKLAEHSVDDSRKFEKMLNEGLINITCK